MKDVFVTVDKKILLTLEKVNVAVVSIKKVDDFEEEVKNLIMKEVGNKIRDLKKDVLMD